MTLANLKRGALALVGAGLVLVMSGCATKYQSATTFPSPDELFVTTGDGDIQKPYTPVGQLIYMRQGFRIPLPLLGMIPIADVDPDTELRRAIYQEVRRMGGDAVINLKIDWMPPNDGILGLFATGGHITVYGTVINR